jgi:hypothetical protein
MSRPAGIPKTGGRKRGVPNKASAIREAEIKAAGVTPLNFMLGVMRDAEKTVEMRLEAAAKAAPYVHPRLASLAVTGEHVIRQGELSVAERRERALRHLNDVFAEPVVVGGKANGRAQD